MGVGWSGLFLETVGGDPESGLLDGFGGIGAHGFVHDGIYSCKIISSNRMAGLIILTANYGNTLWIEVWRL